jgi:hypothetical protein
MENLLQRTVSRREFTAASLSALFVGMAVTLIDCGGGGASSSLVTAPTPIPTASGPSTPTPAVSGDKSGAISDNHGHEAVVTSAQLTAAGAVALSIRGSADHDHAVTLSAAQIGQVAGGTRVTAVSATGASTDIYGVSAHTHSVVFN